MATYEEVHGLKNDSALRNKVEVAIGVAADTIRQEPGSVDNHANRRIWAKDVMENPSAMAKRTFFSILIANRAATVEQIKGASTAAIQANVDAVVDLFAQG